MRFPVGLFNLIRRDARRCKPLLLAGVLAAASGFTFSFAGSNQLQLLLVRRNILDQRLRQGDVPAKEREQLIERMFTEVGCQVNKQPLDKRSDNVICDLPGETGETIIVGGHYDFIDRGQGIVDDWSGTSMLVSLYQTLKFTPHKHSYEFVAFTGEERGLLGSTRYVKDLKNRPALAPLAFVNLECLGLSSPKVWLSRSSAPLVGQLLAMAKAMHIPLSGVDVEKIGDDDTHPFFSKKIPVISIHSLTQETWPILHTSKDTAAAVNSGDYYDAYRLVAFYLAYLDTAPPPAAQPHR